MNDFFCRPDQEQMSKGKSHQQTDTETSTESKETLKSIVIETVEGMSAQCVRKLLVQKHLETQLTNVMDKWIASYSAGCTGGKMRGDRGNDLEVFIRNSISYIADVEKVALRAVKGSSDKKELKITHKGKDIVKHHQVDVHIYKDNVFTAVIECKAYLDSCYYVRACDDFNLFKKFGYDVKKYIFTLEDSLDEDTKVFTDHVNDNVCDDIFIMLEGKRSSAKPIYDQKYKKTVIKENLAKYIDCIYRLL